MKTKIFLMIASLAILSFTSCKKDFSPLEQSALNLADDEAVSDAVFEDIFNTADNASIQLDNMMKSGDTKSEIVSGDPCPVITVKHPSTGIWPKIVTIDYGTGCTGFFNNTRSGKIKMEVTGPRREEGSKRTVTFEDYYFNEIKVEGTKVTENMGINSNMNVNFRVILTGGKLTMPDGKTIERTFEHQREWTAGFQTRNIWDDECLITGFASGRNIEGYAYIRTIITALQWKRACNFIVSGVVKIEKEGTDPFELDYGMGECDNKALVKRGDDSKEILLRHRHRSMIH